MPYQAQCHTKSYHTDCQDSDSCLAALADWGGQYNCANSKDHAKYGCSGTNGVWAAEIQGCCPSSCNLCTTVTSNVTSIGALTEVDWARAIRSGSLRDPSFGVEEFENSCDARTGKELRAHGHALHAHTPSARTTRPVAYCHLHCHCRCH